MDAKELTRMIISERLGYYFQQNRVNSLKENRQNLEFRKLLEERNPNLADAFAEYLERRVKLEATNQENIYLFGLHDGIRLIRYIISAE